MSPEFVTGFIFEALKVTILLAAPVLLSGLIAGLSVSIFQAATQINEMTLVFIPKMLAVGIALVVFLPWMLNIIVTFAHDLFINIPNYIR
ncbi:MAG: flagellar biosynthesis protein FliQ [Thermodesulfobacteriota bacterium]|nr:flagellar biosynthesis protein FliQ [Thermodesulfobacteriota bacterium]